MRKHLFTTLLLGVVIGLIGFCAFFYLSTAAHREMLQTDAPELAWVRREFQLSPEQFEQFKKLHDAYQPHCRAMCEKIDAKNAQIQALLAAMNAVTPEVKQALAEAANLRAECQTAMLTHCYEASRLMTPEQAKRYLLWVQRETLLPGKMLPENTEANK